MSQSYIRWVEVRMVGCLEVRCLEMMLANEADPIQEDLCFNGRTGTVRERLAEEIMNWSYW